MKRCIPPFSWSVFKFRYPDDAKITPGVIGPSLLLAECFTARGEGHMVLIADGLCLDNLRAELLPFDSTGYDWSLPMQSKDDPNVWVKN